MQMKKFLLAGAAVAALASGAQAADLGVRRVAVPAAIAAPVFSWTGFYIGANVGYSSAQFRYVDPTGTFANTSLTMPGIFGGIQGGYNWQMNSLVLGVEADIQANSANKRFPLSATTGFRDSVPMFGSLRARAGFAADRALFYVTGGLGYATLSTKFYDTVTPANNLSASTTRFGYTVGAGIEYAITNNWTVKGEYLYYGFSNTRPGFTATDRLTSNIHTVKLGVNYLFSTGPSAVVARY
jgi:outer membrane immunogenic protein